MATIETLRQFIFDMCLASILISWTLGLVPDLPSGSRSPLPVRGVELDLAFLDFGVYSRKLLWYLRMFSDCDIELSGSVQERLESM